MGDSRQSSGDGRISASPLIGLASLVNCEYEICRACGANHTAVVPLNIPEGSSSGMYWCPDRLKPGTQIQ